MWRAVAVVVLTVMTLNLAMTGTAVGADVGSWWERVPAQTRGASGASISYASVEGGTVRYRTVNAPSGARGLAFPARGARVLTGPVGWKSLVLEGVVMGVWYGGKEVIGFDTADWDWEEQEDSALQGTANAVHTACVHHNQHGSFWELTVQVGTGANEGEYRVGVLGPDDGGNVGSVWRTSHVSTPHETEDVYEGLDWYCDNPSFSTSGSADVEEAGDPYPRWGPWITMGEASHNDPHQIFRHTVRRPNEDPDYRASIYTYTQLGDQQGRVVTEWECYEASTDTTYTHASETDWYSSHNFRPNMPAPHCGEGQEISKIHVYRELTDGSIRTILGGDTATEVEDPPEMDSLEYWDLNLPDPSGTPTRNIGVVPNPAPSEVEDPGDEQIWDDCFDNPDCRLYLENVQENREADAFQDAGWWLDPQRDTKYQCRLEHPSLGTAVLPLAECRWLTWDGPGESTSTDEQTQPDTDPDPEPEPSPPPTLPPGTMTGQPPGSPTFSDCVASAEVSWFNPMVVFVGTACALKWAFVPSEGFMTEVVTQSQTVTESTLPFSLLPVITTHMPQIVPLPGQGTCSVDIWAFPPESATPDGFPQLSIPCEPPWNHTVPYLLMSAGVIIMVVRGVWNMLSKPLGAPGDGFSDNSLGGHLS